MRGKWSASVLLATAQFLSLIPASVCQLNVDFSKPDSIRAGAKTVAASLVSDYKDQKNFIPGLLPEPYFFWQSGLFFNTLIDYAAYTGDDAYNSLFQNDFYNQIGNDDNFIPANQTQGIANDDVAYWALAAMTAAEYDAKTSSTPSYLTLAENVFNNLVQRWDTKSCGGGLRWTIFSFQNGYDYKDTNTNGAFFQLAARLALETGNKTYSEWAEKVYDWSAKVNFIDSSNGAVFSGAATIDDCKNIDKLQISSSAAVFVYGSAVMANITKSELWRNRTIYHVTNSYASFFTPEAFVDTGSSNVLQETACEPENHCNQDQKSAKSILLRALASASVLGPDYLQAMINDKLLATAKAAAKSCNTDGECSFVWTQLKYNGTTGVSEKMGVLESFIGVLKTTTTADEDVFADVSGPVSSATTTGSPTGSPTGSASQTAEAPAATTSTSNIPSSGNMLHSNVGSISVIAVFVSFLYALL